MKEVTSSQQHVGILIKKKSQHKTSPAVHVQSTWLHDTIYKIKRAATPWIGSLDVMYEFMCIDEINIAIALKGYSWEVF